MVKKYGFRVLVPMNYDLWFCEKHNKWHLFDRIPPDADNWQDWYPVCSLKAAKRHLRKHTEIPIGAKFTDIKYSVFAAENYEI